MQLGKRQADLAEEPERVPVKAVRQPDRSVRKAAELRKTQLFPVEAARNGAAALGAEIERDMQGLAQACLAVLAAKRAADAPSSERAQLR